MTSTANKNIIIKTKVFFQVYSLYSDFILRFFVMKIKLPFELNLEEIAKITEGDILFPSDFGGERKSQNNLNLCIRYISTDTREDVSQSLFVPIKGSRFDGHDFIAEASRKGAVVSLCDMKKISELNLRKLNIPLVVVEDTSFAFLKLGKWVREKISPFVIAVGGSAGKTTTKELIYFIFSQAGFRTSKSIKSFNNRVGLSISMCMLESGTEVAVFEIGTSKKGEVSELVSFAEPSMGVLVSVGKEHLEGLGSEKNVFEEEFSLIRYVLEKNGIAVFNFSDDMTADAISTLSGKKIGFLGIKGKDSEVKKKTQKVEKSNWNEGKLTRKVEKFFKEGGYIFTAVRPTYVSDMFETKFSVYVYVGNSHGISRTVLKVDTNLAPHFCENLACGLSVFLGYMYFVHGEAEPEELGALDFRGFKNEPGRFVVRKIEGKNIIVVDDTYNSNPLSQEALFYSASFSGRRKIFVLGDMLELGEFSQREHENLGSIASKYLGNKDSIFFVFGEFSEYMRKGFEKVGFYSESFRKKDELLEKLRRTVREGDVLFLKASRGRKFENILNEFVELLS